MIAFAADCGSPIIPVYGSPIIPFVQTRRRGRRLSSEQTTR